MNDLLAQLQNIQDKKGTSNRSTSKKGNYPGVEKNHSNGDKIRPNMSASASIHSQKTKKSGRYR